MDWYIPITIVPGVGMLVLSTTSQMMGLSAEIGRLLAKKCSVFQQRIAHLKIQQLTRLTRAATLLYVSAALFVLSGIWSGIFAKGAVGSGIVLTGVAATFGALALLIVYGYNTIGIRKLQHEYNHEM